MRMRIPLWAVLTSGTGVDINQSVPLASVPFEKKKFIKPHSCT